MNGQWARVIGRWNKYRESDDSIFPSRDACNWLQKHNRHGIRGQSGAACTRIYYYNSCSAHGESNYIHKLGACAFLALFSIIIDKDSSPTHRARSYNLFWNKIITDRCACNCNCNEYMRGYTRIQYKQTHWRQAPDATAAQKSPTSRKVPNGRERARLTR